MFQFTLIWRGCIDLRNSWDKKDSSAFPNSWLVKHTVLKNSFAKACLTLASLTAGHCGILNVLICFHFFADDNKKTLQQLSFQQENMKGDLKPVSSETGLRSTSTLQTVHLWTKQKQIINLSLSENNFSEVQWLVFCWLLKLLSSTFQKHSQDLSGW